MSQSLVIGNGESRSNINISDFSIDHDLIGCNAIHRDISVEHLVCCDRRMVEEAVIGDLTENTKIYVREDWFRYFRKIRKDKRIHQVPDLPYVGELKQDQPVHWGSGPYAVLLAAQNYETIKLLGFDLYPTNERVNNIYKGTKNYNDKYSKPVDYNYWVYQVAKVFKHYKEKEFIVLNKKGWEFPREWRYSNVRFEDLF